MQIKNSFDPETVAKVIKGLGYSLLGGLSAALTAYSTTNNLKASLLTGLIAMLVPFSANAGVQYNKGGESE